MNHQGVGFVPSDDMGFVGADDALEKLLQNQAPRISGDSSHGRGVLVRSLKMDASFEGSGYYRKMCFFDFLVGECIFGMIFFLVGEGKLSE